MSKYGKIAIILFIIILISAFSTYGVLYAFEGKKIPIIDKIITVPYSEESPEQVISGMVEKFKTIKTAKYQLDINYNNSIWQVPVELNSKVSFAGGFIDQLRGNLVVENELVLPDTIINIDVNTVYSKDGTFFKITRIPSIPVTDFEAIKDVWYEIDTSEEAEKFNLAGLSSGIINIIQRFPDEVINNELSYHYSVRLDKDSVADLFSSSSVFDVFLQINFEQVTNWNIEIWIEKEGLKMNKITGIYSDNKVNANFSLMIDDFNETIKLEYPSFGKSKNDFYKDIFDKTNLLDLPLFGYLAGIETENITKDIDDDGLFDIWEEFFKTDSKKADSDGDGFNDGMEIRNGYNPIGNGELEIF